MPSPPKLQNYFWAVYQRPAPAPRLRPLWAPFPIAASTTRYLLDAAPGGRVDAIKTFYDASGAPTWRTAAAGLPAAASGAVTSAAALDAQWHRLVLSASSRQEPYLTKEEERVRFQLAAGGTRLTVAEGGGPPQALAPGGSLAGPANGLWYSAVDDTYYGLFVTSSRAAPSGYLAGYLLGWRAGDGEPTRWTLMATWPGVWGGKASSVARLFNCRLAAGRMACTYDASLKGLKVIMDASGTAMAIEGLPGAAAPLALLKASTATPVLNSPPFA